MQNYSYPIASDWSTDEIIQVTKFYNAVEQAYEKGIDLDAFKAVYSEFKQIVTSKSEEKKISKEFESVSGYSIYLAVKEMKLLLTEQTSTSKAKIKLNIK